MKRVDQLNQLIRVARCFEMRNWILFIAAVFNMTMIPHGAQGPAGV